MLSDARRRETYAYLQRHGSASVGQIAEWLAVSSQTVRRDLDRLGREGLVERVRGGAVVRGPGPAAAVPSGTAPEVGASDEGAERRIAARAATLIAPGSTVFLSGGSAAAHVTSWLGEIEGLTVVTNALDVAAALCALPHVQAIVLMGALRHERRTLLGALTERAVAEVSLDHALLAPHGLDSELALYAPAMAEAALERELLQRARRTTLLASARSFARRGPFRTARTRWVREVVLERSVPEGTRAAVAATGVEVLAA